jgi:ABC-type multidrug transport system ATPase subunit
MSALVSCTGVSVRYRASGREGWRLEVPTFEIAPSDFCLVSGDNMSGKTSFLRFIGGIESGLVFDGEVLRDQMPVDSVEALAGLSVVLSSDDRMFPELSIWDNVNLAVAKAERLSEAMPQVEAFLERANVFRGRTLDTPLGALSSGGRGIVKFCRALISSRSLILMDEISSFLDDARAHLVLAALADLAAAGRAVILVSHSDRDRRFIAEHYRVRRFHLRRELDRSVFGPLEEAGV